MYSNPPSFSTLTHALTEVVTSSSTSFSSPQRRDVHSPWACTAAMGHGAAAQPPLWSESFTSSLSTTSRPEALSALVPRSTLEPGTRLPAHDFRSHTVWGAFLSPTASPQTVEPGNPWSPAASTLSPYSAPSVPWPAIVAESREIPELAFCPPTYGPQPSPPRSVPVVRRSSLFALDPRMSSGLAKRRRQTTAGVVSANLDAMVKPEPPSEDAGLSLAASLLDSSVPSPSSPSSTTYGEGGGASWIPSCLEDLLPPPVPAEVPLRACNATPAMRRMMGVFRLDPFAMHDGVHAASRPGVQDTAGTRLRDVSVCWNGEHAGPLRGESVLVEFQCDLDKPDALVPNQVKWPHLFPDPPCSSPLTDTDSIEPLYPVAGVDQLDACEHQLYHYSPEPESDLVPLAPVTSPVPTAYSLVQQRYGSADATTTSWPYAPSVSTDMYRYTTLYEPHLVQEQLHPQPPYMF